MAQTAGVILKQHPEEGKDAQIAGSMVVYAAENVEEVRDIISKDIYATSGVWDLEKVQIFPVSDDSSAPYAWESQTDTYRLSTFSIRRRFGNLLLNQTSKSPLESELYSSSLEVFSRALNPTLIYFHLRRVLDPSISSLIGP